MWEGGRQGQGWWCLEEVSMGSWEDWPLPFWSACGWDELWAHPGESVWDIVVPHLHFQSRLTLGSAGNQVSETKQVELPQPPGRGLTSMKRSLTFLSFECPDNKGGKYESCAPYPGGARFLAWPDLDVPFTGWGGQTQLGYQSSSLLVLVPAWPFTACTTLGTVGVSLGYIWIHTWIFWYRLMSSVYTHAVCSSSVESPRGFLRLLV